ncbi:MAG: hypothetical protein SFV17_15310 [Candidatus Obscuribacter sp.]|nr:hypothetical protein [Candidatus Obscuribacter sp.]
MTDYERPPVGIGYPLTMLVKALAGEGEASETRVGKWRKVIWGILSGNLQVGSRTPVLDTPPWVTLEVVHGGFATGGYMAGGKLQPYELKKLSSVRQTLEASGDASAPALAALKKDRRLLNLYYLSDPGLAELQELLARRTYRIDVPEESALLVLAWLQNRGEEERAEQVVQEISPFFERLRFYPLRCSELSVPVSAAAERPNSEPSVFVRSVGEVMRGLRSKPDNVAVSTMNEAISVWAPLYDRCVELFMQTVEGELPEFQKDDDGKLLRAENGQPLVRGGWPCKHYPHGWQERGRQLLIDYKEARDKHSLCGKPEKKKENFARLRSYLATICDEPDKLTGYDVGMIRRILAAYVTAHGAPGSERLQSFRRTQEDIAALPLHSKLARVLAERLALHPGEGGLKTPAAVLLPLAEEEIAGVGGRPGLELPVSLAAKVECCLEAPLPVLLSRRLVKSGEVMAALRPALTAAIRVSSIEDPALACLFRSSYQAFRKRRSLLLLNLESQVRFEELPWIAALEPWVGNSQASVEAARRAMEQVTELALANFPQTILPNKLVRELRALANASELRIALVDELAADIFMGTFSANFLNAAKAAAGVLRGTIYERYYGLDYEAVLAIDDVITPERGPGRSAAFDNMCHELAGTSKAGKQSWSAARNGAIIEQAQILTTHNLAALVDALSLAEALKPQLQNLAFKCFTWICRRLEMKCDSWRNDLHSIKNSAYAFRQMLFYLALIEKLGEGDTVKSTLKLVEEHFETRGGEFKARFEPALLGLREVAAGSSFGEDGSLPSGGRRFLGWTTGKHWLRRG